MSQIGCRMEKRFIVLEFVVQVREVKQLYFQFVEKYCTKPFILLCFAHYQKTILRILRFDINSQNLSGYAVLVQNRHLNVIQICCN